MASPVGGVGGGAGVSGYVQAGPEFIAGSAFADGGYNSATGELGADVGTRDMFNLDLGPIGSLAIGGNVSAGGHGNRASGDVGGSLDGFLSGSFLGHSFGGSGSASGSFGW